MNILFLTIAWPKQGYNLYSDLMEEFVKHGHKVYVATTNEKRNNSETHLKNYNGINVLNIKCGNITKVKKYEKGISLLSLSYNFKRAIKAYWGELSYDLIIMSTPPVNLLKTYKALKKEYKAKTYLLLKDIWPQGPADLGAFKTNGTTYRYFRILEKELYSQSDFIGCMSEKNIEYLLKHNDNIESRKVEVNPNSIKPRFTKQSPAECTQIREKYGIPTNKTVLIYGGNLGKPQGIDFLMQCLKSNEKNDGAFIVIAGSGTEYEKLNEFFNREELKNSKLFSHIPKDDYDLLVNNCDVGLIFLDNRFTIPNFPSRLLSYMQASIPVLAFTDRSTDIGKVIEKGEFGFWAESGDVEGFRRNISLMCSDPQLRETMGTNARHYLEGHYTVKHSYDIIMKHFI